MLHFRFYRAHKHQTCFLEPSSTTFSLFLISKGLEAVFISPFPSRNKKTTTLGYSIYLKTVSVYSSGILTLCLWFHLKGSWVHLGHDGRVERHCTTGLLRESEDVDFLHQTKSHEKPWKWKASTVQQQRNESANSQCHDGIMLQDLLTKTELQEGGCEGHWAPCITDLGVCRKSNLYEVRDNVDRGFVYE